MCSLRLLLPAICVQFYKLTNSHQQISSYVFDVVRATVPKMDLDSVFVEKRQIAQSIKEVCPLVVHCNERGHMCACCCATKVRAPFVVMLHKN